MANSIHSFFLRSSPSSTLRSLGSEYNNYVSMIVQGQFLICTLLPVTLRPLVFLRNFFLHKRLTSYVLDMTANRQNHR